jgi:molybdopterin-guanine dinucleotide biosynthesis protein A
MEDCIREGNRGLREFIEKVKVFYISEDKVKIFDPEGRSFVNINTIKDYERELKTEQIL